MRYSGFVYPYPSSVNVANFVKITLSSKNFLAWESQMINMIETFDLMGFLDGTFPMPMPNVLTTLPNGSEIYIPNPDNAIQPLRR